ncbi:hypothetical protein [Actinoplanes sp. GCM10030250]|uniref:hypothetical protein n=1 Tax=Actinoplanes sp. GCM10030250 TaxID=3273376 RepID=UPI0036185A40
MTLGEPPVRLCSNPDSANAAAHPRPAGVLQGSYRGRWALQLDVRRPAPSDPADADDVAVLHLGPIQDLLGALYDNCPCAQLRGRRLSRSPAELFLVLFYARIVAGIRAIGAPPDDQWILNDAERANLGDDEILDSLKQR